MMRGARLASAKICASHHGTHISLRLLHGFLALCDRGIAAGLCRQHQVVAMHIRSNLRGRVPLCIEHFHPSGDIEVEEGVLYPARAFVACEHAAVQMQAL